MESAAKLSAGARRMGTSIGLLPRACGAPENQTCGIPGVRIGDIETGTGIIVGGSERAGWCDISGVSGGGRMSENSVAREVSGVCLGASAMRRLVFSDRSPTRDCGVMSCA